MAQLQIQLPIAFPKLDLSEEVIHQLPESVEKRTFFFVTDEVFEQSCIKRYKNGIRCSEFEVQLINQHLGDDNGQELTVEAFAFENNVNCEKCKRQINFYDVFLQGVAKHGLGFMKWAILGKKKVQMFPDEINQTIVCSECQHSIVTVGAYNHYSGGSYACA